MGNSSAFLKCRSIAWRMEKLLNSGPFRITGARTFSAVSLTQVTGQPQPFTNQRRRRPDLLGRKIILVTYWRAMKTVRLVVLMLACIAVGVAAGYRLASIKEHTRLERNKTLARLSHDKVWSERNNEAALKVAREIYSNDFVAHDWRGDNTGGLAAFPQSIADGRADYPDWTEKVESMVAEGDFVAVRFLSTGTQGRGLAAVPHVMPVIPNKHRL